MLVLQNAPRERLAALASDPAFIGRLASADAARRAYLTRRSWFEQQYPQSPFTRVAYFSMEFGVTDALPMYVLGLARRPGRRPPEDRE